MLGIPCTHLRFPFLNLEHVIVYWLHALLMGKVFSYITKSLHIPSGIHAVSLSMVLHSKYKYRSLLFGN